MRHHNFYHIESEAVADVNGDISVIRAVTRLLMTPTIRHRWPTTGNVDWAGVGDAYFAMAAVPATPAQGLEYRAIEVRRPDRAVL